jgi:hypothetical protein
MLAVFSRRFSDGKEWLAWGVFDLVAFLKTRFVVFILWASDSFHRHLMMLPDDDFCVVIH